MFRSEDLVLLVYELNKNGASHGSVVGQVFLYFLLSMLFQWTEMILKDK